MARSSRTLNLPLEDGRLMHVNASMFFVVTFHHIYILSTVRTMFLMDFGNFRKKPIILVLIMQAEKTSFSIFNIHGARELGTELGQWVWLDNFHTNPTN
jgi:hypothetical protein